MTCLICDGVAFVFVCRGEMDRGSPVIFNGKGDKITETVIF